MSSHATGVLSRALSLFSLSLSHTSLSPARSSYENSELSRSFARRTKASLGNRIYYDRTVDRATQVGDLTPNGSPSSKRLDPRLGSLGVAPVLQLCWEIRRRKGYRQGGSAKLNAGQFSASYLPYPNARLALYSVLR